MTLPITVLTVADLHRGKALYDLLGTTVTRHRPDILALVGDFLDATGEQERKLTTEECARLLSRLPCPETVFIRGNHEDSAWFVFAEEWKASGRELHLLEGQAFTYGTPLSAAEGYLAGNIEWTVAIERFSPWLVVFGHDHQTPLRRKLLLWHHRLAGNTACVNVGQTAKGPLHYCLVELQFSQVSPCLPTTMSVTAYPKGKTIHLPLRS